MSQSQVRSAVFGFLSVLACKHAIADEETGHQGVPRTQAPAKLYVGYYAEDSNDNPEDPTVGTVILRIPEPDQSFSGLMSFSFFGCMPGADVGTVRGTRSPAHLNGKWVGTVDGVAVGGAFTGDYSAAEDSFTGRFGNAGGKKRVTAKNCSYYVAGAGSYKLFGSMTNQPADFVATATAGSEPKLSWSSPGGDVHYRVQRFDEQCLIRSAADLSCFVAEALTDGRSVKYPADFPLARAPRLPGKLLALVTAIDSEGRFAGLSALRMILGERR